MSDWYDLTRSLNDALASVREHTAELDRLGKTKARAEYDYRCALAVKVLKLRDEKVPVTIINDLARGDADVATLRLKRDIAEAELDACREIIMSSKKEVDVYREQMAREWNQGGEPW